MLDMTCQKKYEATDDDLPDNFWSNSVPVTPTVSIDSGKHVQMAMERLYPAIRDKFQQRIERSKKRSIKADLDKSRKQYIKSAKREQMHEWLYSMVAQQCWDGMEDFEFRFFRQLLQKFEQYYPKVKWLTMKQYLYLKQLASKYLDIPNV